MRRPHHPWAKAETRLFQAQGNVFSPWVSEGGVSCASGVHMGEVSSPCPSRCCTSATPRQSRKITSRTGNDTDRQAAE